MVEEKVVDEKHDAAPRLHDGIVYFVEDSIGDEGRKEIIMGVCTKAERRRLIENLRKHYDRIFPGRGGVRRFAEAVGVSPRTVSRWLNGVLLPSQARLHTIAKVLEVSERVLCERRKTPVQTGLPAGLPEIVQGQIEAIDTHILLLRHSKRALTGKADARRHREGVRIIGDLLKTELNEG